MDVKKSKKIVMLACVIINDFLLPNFYLLGIFYSVLIYMRLK